MNRSVSHSVNMADVLSDMGSYNVEARMALTQ